MDVLNLSIGGPDYLDLPFVEKVSCYRLIRSDRLVNYNGLKELEKLSIRMISSSAYMTACFVSGRLFTC